VKVDHEIWGCPVTSYEVLSVIRQLLFGVVPPPVEESLCLACKRSGTVCVLVAKGEPCMGPVTKTGCGVLCPKVSRACYGCFGPNENPNTKALTQRFLSLGFSQDQIKRYFLQINNQANAFKHYLSDGKKSEN
jgi:coenzyme F420-reducing hydrogenase gamma subunit